MEYSFKSHLFKFLELKSSDKNLLGVLRVTEINPEYSLEGLMLKLKLQYFGHLLERADSLEKTLMFRKIECGRRRRQQVTEDEMVGWHHQLDGHEFEQAPVDGEGQGSLACRSPWGHKESDTTERLTLSLFFSSMNKTGGNVVHILKTCSCNITLLQDIF